MVRYSPYLGRSGWVMLLGNLQCQGVLLVWIKGPTPITVLAVGGCLNTFLLSIIPLF